MRRLMAGVTEDDIMKALEHHAKIESIEITDDVKLSEVLQAADALAQILHNVLNGGDLREAILAHGCDWFSRRRAEQWSREPDEVVIGTSSSSRWFSL